MEASRLFTTDSKDKTSLNVLSVDWDVFHDMRQFMPGSMECEIDWIVEYSRWSGEFVHTYKFFKDEYRQLSAFLSRVNIPVYFAENHSDIVKCVPANTDIRLTNLDYHCDTGLFRGQLYCGNWMSYLVREYNCKIDLDWRCLFHKDFNALDKSGLDNDLPFNPKIGFDGVFSIDYDMVFVCQSYPYSPPHMSHYLTDLTKVCKKPIYSASSPMFFPTYSERWTKFYEESLTGVNNYSPYTMYFPTGKETPQEMDDIYDDHDNIIVHGVDVLKLFPDCDEHYRQ